MIDFNNTFNLKLGSAHRLARSNYMPRVLGFSAAFIVMVLLGLNRNWANWSYFMPALYFLIYPHLVFLASKLAPGRKKVELRAMQLDAFMVGIWTIYIHFFVWMSYAFLSAIVLNSIMVGGFRELFRGLIIFTAGLLIGVGIMGFDIALEGPFYIELLAMISLLLYIIIAGLAFYKQTRYLAELKVELEEKNDTLNETVEELEMTRDELVTKAHKAGMADLATGVLHNVGNILNSINISSSIIDETLTKSPIHKLTQANKMLAEHIDELEPFLLRDPRGKKLMQYYLKLETPLQQEHEQLQIQCRRLSQKVNLIVEVIDAQQDYAQVGRIKEQLQLERIIEDTLTLQAGSIERHSLDIVTDLRNTDKVIIQKSKVIHILVNLFKNAKEAMAGERPGEKKITIRTWQDADHVYLSVSDNGHGIAPKQQNEVFKHGFTTKMEGHGFGLHSCANYMTEMGGKIKVHSEGVDQGTTFTLIFPRKKNDAVNAQKTLTHVSI